MNFIALGIFLLVHICSYSIADAAGYNDACTDNANCTSTGQICTDEICACDTGRNYSYVGSKCVKELGSGCSDTSDCNDVAVICDTNVCKCNTLTYYDTNGSGTGGSCIPKVELGSSGCSSAVSDSCLSPNAQCQSNGGQCTCDSGYYDSNGGDTIGGTCTQKVQLGSSGCSRAVSDSCMSPNAHCQSNGGQCTCDSGYYDSNGGDSIGGICTKKLELGDTGCSRSVTDSCKDVNAECLSSDGPCTCKSGFYDDNGDSYRGTCKSKIRLGEPGCSTSVSNSCKDVKSRCNGTGGYCICITGYYDAGGTCESDKGLGKACSGQQNECADSAAECLDGKCTCGINYYDSNGFTEGGNCASISELTVLAINFPTDSVKTSGFKVTWSPPSADKVSEISEYGIEWTPKTQDNSLAGGSNGVSNTVTSLVIASGVSAGKTYNVKVISKNLVTQMNAPRTTFLSKEQAAKPDIPRLLATPDLNALDETIRVGWSAPATGVASRYKIRLLDGTKEIAGTESSSPPVSLSSSEMKNGYNYNVEITARSEAYDGSNYIWSEKYVEQIKTVVQVPSAPRSVTCGPIKDESITLTWPAPEFPNGDLVKYTVQVLSVAMQPLFNSSTTQPVESRTVTSLSPGTTYKFRVFTVNEMYTSVNYGESGFCMTKAKLSDPPSELQTTAVTSRNITISWNEPNNIYSEEIYGYVIQLKQDDTCMKEVIYRCSNCRGFFQPSDLENMCGSPVQVLFQKNKTELSGLQSYKFIALLPDTTYSISGTAVNNLGRGNIIEISQDTEEEAPQTPFGVEVSDIGTTSFKVSWTIDGPRPGQTNFSISLWADKPAANKETTLTGFTTRSHTFINLQEYWNYSVTVIAVTSKGSKKSDRTKEYRTLPAAPGQVSNFELTPAPGRNYRKMQVSWNAPATLLQNGVIKDYRFSYSSVQEPDLKLESQETIQHQSLDNYEYKFTVNVLPEVTYTFEVYATNEQNMTGALTTKTQEAPAGVPINIEKTQNVEIIPKDEIKNIQETRFTVTFIQEFFEESTNGDPQATGIRACGKNCDDSNITSLSEFNTAPNWKTGLNSGWYRLTKSDWLTKAKNKDTEDRRRKRSLTELEYTVGSDDCSQINEGEYCNGPLQPGTSYLLVAISCTNGGCLSSKAYGPFITKAVPEETDSTPMIIGIVAAVVVLLAVGGVVGYIMLRRRRSGPGKMKPAKDSDDDDFTTVDPALAKIPRKRPILLSNIEEYVNNMHRDSNLLFSSEYEDLKTLSPKHSCEAADKEENRMRNRYINIIPFDHTRVKLSTNGEDDSSDYINANYLPGYNSPREYIGCQGPIPGTIDDFWRMTWEQNVSVIVMLTLCKEGQKIKCEQYWPDEVGEPKQYGDVIVEITSYSNIRTYDYRMFKITNGSTTRVVKHFHFLSWLDFQANVHHDIILDFIQHVRQHVQPPDTSGPMIIHCSAGVGRTGTYIALDHLIQFINDHDFDVEIDVFDLVLKLRENRQHMVQTEQQYVFIHDCVKEIIDRKRQSENIYVNQAFSQDENIYQNEQSLYANVSVGKTEQNTEL